MTFLGVPAVGGLKFSMAHKKLQKCKFGEVPVGEVPVWERVSQESASQGKCQLRNVPVGSESPNCRYTAFLYCQKSKIHQENKKNQFSRSYQNASVKNSRLLKILAIPAVFRMLQKIEMFVFSSFKNQVRYRSCHFVTWLRFRFSDMSTNS